MRGVSLAAREAAFRSPDRHPADLLNRDTDKVRTFDQIRKTPLAGRVAYLAERGGFEPPVRYKRTPDFESGTFNHSATSPVGPAPARGGEPGRT